jgi:hypothetical protein
MMADSMDAPASLIVTLCLHVLHDKPGVGGCLHAPAHRSCTMTFQANSQNTKVLA